MNENEAPWYLLIGLVVGIIAGFSSLIFIVGSTVHEQWGNYYKRYMIPALLLGFTAWWWLPWLFYGLSRLPLPPMPPPKDQPAQVEKV